MDENGNIVTKSGKPVIVSGYVMINGKGPVAVPEAGNITDPKKAIVLARVTQTASAQPFTLDFIPPAGSSLPVAVVVLTTYLSGKASLTWSGAKAPVTATKTVAFTPS